MERQSQVFCRKRSSNRSGWNFPRRNENSTYNPPGSGSIRSGNGSALVMDRLRYMRSHARLQPKKGTYLSFRRKRPCPTPAGSLLRRAGLVLGPLQALVEKDREEERHEEAPPDAAGRAPELRARIDVRDPRDVVRFERPSFDGARRKRNGEHHRFRAENATTSRRATARPSRRVRKSFARACTSGSSGTSPVCRAKRNFG